MRQSLSTRRPAIVRKLEWQTDVSVHKFHVSVGFDPKTGRVCEVFYSDGQKVGSLMQHTIQDACVLISLLLQHDVPPHLLCKSLSTTPVLGDDTARATIVGVIADAVAEEAAIKAPPAATVAPLSPA